MLTVVRIESWWAWNLIPFRKLSRNSISSKDHGVLRIQDCILVLRHPDSTIYNQAYFGFTARTSLTKSFNLWDFTPKAARRGSGIVRPGKRSNSDKKSHYFRGAQLAWIHDKDQQIHTIPSVSGTPDVATGLYLTDFPVPSKYIDIDEMRTEGNSGNGTHLLGSDRRSARRSYARRRRWKSGLRCLCSGRCSFWEERGRLVPSLSVPIASREGRSWGSG